MSNCKDKISYTCGKRVNARCVDYEGDLSECTELDKDCGIHTVHEVLEDVAKRLTDICDDLDMTNVEMDCLELEATEPKLPEVLSAVIAKLCETQEGDCNLIFNTPIECANFDYGCLVDECGVDIAPSNLKELLQTMINHSCECCDGGGETPPAPENIYGRVLSYRSHANDYAIPLRNWASGSTGYLADMTHTITTGSGLYEIYIETSVSADAGGVWQGKIAARVNGTIVVPPFPTPFGSNIEHFKDTDLSVTGNNTPITTKLYMTLTQGDTIAPDISVTYTDKTQNQFDYIRCTIKKV